MASREGGADLLIPISLEHSASGAGPGMRRQMQEMNEASSYRKDFKGAIPGRSLVPAAQAQPGAASTQLAAVRSLTVEEYHIPHVYIPVNSADDCSWGRGI